MSNTASLLQLAMYKGPANGFFKQLWHEAVCLITKSKYSHCELVISELSQDGASAVCASSSNRDGGVRIARIDLTSGRWDIVDLPASPATVNRVYNWFELHAGEGYDYLGLLHFLFPRVVGDPRRWFCSEACAAALGLTDPWQCSPQGLLNRIQEVV